MASFSASRTVISFCPDAYPLLATIDGVIAAARKAGRKPGREADDSRREAGRRSLEAAIVVEEGDGGGRGWIDRERVMALRGIWSC
jgi:hypothetical protein